MPHSPMDIYAQYRAIDKRVYGVSYRAFKTRYAEFETVGKMINTRDERGNPVTYMPQAISGYQNLDELNQKFYTLAFRVTAAETLDLPGASSAATTTLGPSHSGLVRQAVADLRGCHRSGAPPTVAGV